ncbi:hypothetical protein CDD82_5448 [Ophiocordyceps australis]|uniref:Methyltransferase type 11 domain-containing protein n=1 Tax=Ophiocordyceps australis TaxID=1399860 RepID=A0A2C5ZT47_9HYPO|nr:hypothetical protein CDD82_5448 [Ophiocordyceps australis]
MAQPNISWPHESWPAPRLQDHNAALSHLKIEAWLSPTSDHFPTPRAASSFVPAPAMPQSPSTASAFASSPSSSPTNSSDAWNRASIDTVTTQFDDIYDVSDQEHQEHQQPPCRLHRSSSVRHNRREQPARLIIPSSIRHQTVDLWPQVHKESHPTSSTLTPSVKLHMSPAQVVLMRQHQALDLPAPSAPPSLDGSLSSDQMASMSAPSTPVVANEEPASPETWSGVHLHPSALATLQALAAQEDVDYRPSSFHSSSLEMRQQSSHLVASLLQLDTRREVLSPNLNRQSLADLASLDIPSPRGFFANLSPRSRSTWHTHSIPVDCMPLPTSATAERFYRQSDCLNGPPFSLPPRLDLGHVSNGLGSSSALPECSIPEQHQGPMDNASIRPVTRHNPSCSIESDMDNAQVSSLDDVPTEIVTDYDPDYARKLQKIALSNLENTEHWLLAQRTYMCAVNGQNLNATIADTDARTRVQKLEQGTSSVAKKKVVRFSSMDIDVSSQEQPSLPREESTLYQVFQRHIDLCQPGDVFVHQLARFEALQAQRVALGQDHRNQLLDKYQLSAFNCTKQRLSANVVREDLDLDENPDRLRKQRAFEAKEQMSISNWHTAATKLLNGGHLVSTPVARRLARQSFKTKKHPVRILDLGGQSVCGWAWHCALEYPHAEVYTATTRALGQLSKSKACSPPNHRHVAVGQLHKLPFANDQFDVVSVRELHSSLKIFGEHGQDEWESCLEECMRVLKPGGYLDFSILDSDIMNAGPLGLAKSVEFGFSLKTLGYDPSPTKTWLRRLDCAGFEHIRRVWMFLPLGPRPKARNPCDSTDCNLIEAGSVDNIAAACSIAGSWSWERWLLRSEVEKVAGELRLVDDGQAGSVAAEAGNCLCGVHDIIEEGRSCNAGFRMLNGYARKPRVDKHSEVIQIALRD